MTPNEAIQMAQSWTKDMKDEGISTQMPIWVMIKTLLDHIDHQSKDIELQKADIQELTAACQLLFRRNKEIQHELSRSKKSSPSLDH